MGRGRATFRNGLPFTVSRDMRRFEDRVANDEVERAAVFDGDGNLIGEFGGIVADNVSIPSSVNVRDMVVTHNHPPDDNGLGNLDPDTAAPSAADLFNSVDRNALAIRAVTPTTVFTVVRGASGWGGSVPDYERSYDAARDRVHGAIRRRYAMRFGMSEEEVPDFSEARRDPDVSRRFRAAGSATMTEDILSDMSRQFGFRVTKQPRSR